jgi:hypothetical protein
MNLSTKVAMFFRTLKCHENAVPMQCRCHTKSLRARSRESHAHAERHADNEKLGNTAEYGGLMRGMRWFDGVGWPFGRRGIGEEGGRRAQTAD